MIKNWNNYVGGKYMKKFLLPLLLLIGCDSNFSGTGRTQNLQDVPGLEDCKFFELRSNLQILYVVRCPNSTTSTRTGGKNPSTTITVDR